MDERSKQVSNEMLYQEQPQSERIHEEKYMALWNDIGVYKINQQRLADQARAIKHNGWLSDVEIEEIKRNIATLK